MTKKEKSDQIKLMMRLMNNALLDNKDQLNGVTSDAIIDACANLIREYCQIIKMDPVEYFKCASEVFSEDKYSSSFAGIKLEYDN